MEGSSTLDISDGYEGYDIIPTKTTTLVVKTVSQVQIYAFKNDALLRILKLQFLSNFESLFLAGER